MKPIGIGVIGAGMVARLFGEAVRDLEEADFVGVATTRESTAKEFAGRYGASVWTADYRQLLARPEVEAVLIPASTNMHAEMTLAAAAAGKHVLVEKPMALNLRDADSMIEACDKAGVKLGVIFMMRFMDSVRLMKETIDSGLLGRIVLAECDTKFYRAPEYYSSREWRQRWSLGGGVVPNNAIHQIDLMLWMLGEVESLSAYYATAVHPIDAEDTAVASVRFRGGVLGQFVGTTAVNPGSPRRLEIWGQKGVLKLSEDALEARGVEVPGLKELKSYDLGASYMEPGRQSSENHRRQIADFIAAIRENRPPLVDGREGRRALEFIRALYQSSESGEAVRFPVQERATGPATRKTLGSAAR